MATRVTRRRLIALGASAVGLCALPAVGFNSPARVAQTKVRMTTGRRTTSQSIAWVGTEAGVFRRHGLDVSFPQLEVGGFESAAGLTRGDWEFAQTDPASIAEAVLSGRDAVVLLNNTAPHVALFIVTRREITSLSQLDGKQVGVLTDAYYSQTGAVGVALEKSGATASYVGHATYEDIYAALTAGEISAGALPVGLRFVGQRQYGWNAFETAVFGAPSVFATTRTLIASNRELVLRAVSAFVETIHLFRTRPDVVMPLLQSFLNLSDWKAVNDLSEFYAPLFPAVPRPALLRMQDIRELFFRRYPAAQRLQETRISDPSLIDQVEQSGFIEQLYAGGSTQ
jgi:hypothetical protein